MDFFEHQDRARRYTTLMVVLFALSVAAIVAVLNLVGVGLHAWVVEMEPTQLRSVFRLTPRWVYAATTALTLGVIAYGTLSRLHELAAGGAAVARMVGARMVKRETHDPLERRLLNVIEEMALASGISAPVAYVLDEQRTINAFAAGYSPNEAIVAVTRGTLEELTRDELQGVIGHEFSHILNGDMRLNVRLMGVIAGIVMIGSLGRYLMDAGRGRSGRAKDGDARLFVAGLALWAVGSIGVFFGSLIKAAVSRQREFLADASSVQFTRNPDGLCGALFKITRRGSTIGERGAGELAHMCIGLPVAGFSELDLLSTHPPLEHRIKRVMGPGAMVLLRERARRAPAPAPGAPAADAAISGAVVAELLSPLAGGGSAAAAPGAAGRSPYEWGKPPASVRTTPQAVLDSVGAPSAAQVDLARRLLDLIPAPVREAARSPEGAKAAVCALLLGEGAVRAAQLGAIGAQSGEALAARTAGLAGLLSGADPRIRMPLLDLSMPVLKVLAPGEREALLALAKTLIEADRRMTVHEFVLLAICSRHLGREPGGPPPVKHSTLATLQDESVLVLALLAHAGRGGQPAFDKGTAALGIAGRPLRPAAELGFAAVEKALYELKLLAPLRKPAFIKGCLETVMADGRLTVAEGELMRALCATLDSPLPPLVDTAVSTP